MILYPFFIAGLYFYIEASDRAMGDVARLVSPRIQSNGNSTCMVFYYHLYGHSIGSLRVKVGDQVLWQLSSNQGDSWHKATVSLNFNGTYQVLTMLLLLNFNGTYQVLTMLLLPTAFYT